MPWKCNGIENAVAYMVVSEVRTVHLVSSYCSCLQAHIGQNATVRPQEARLLSVCMRSQWRHLVTVTSNKAICNMYPFAIPIPYTFDSIVKFLWPNYASQVDARTICMAFPCMLSFANVSVKFHRNQEDYWENFTFRTTRPRTPQGTLKLDNAFSRKSSLQTDREAQDKQ